MSEGLGGLAALAATEHDHARCACLFGAARRFGAIADPGLIEELERRFYAPARAALGTAVWQERVAAGMRLSFRDAIDFALTPPAGVHSDVEPRPPAASAAQRNR